MRKPKIPRISAAYQAVLLNRWVALVTETIYNTKGTKKQNVAISERTFYKIQWKNIAYDIKRLFRNPAAIAPQIAYSLAAFWFIFQGKHIDAHLTAFPIMIGAIAYDTAGQSSHSGEPSTVTITVTVANVANRVALMFMSSLSGGGTVTFDGNSPTGNVLDVGNLEIDYYTAPGTGSKNTVFSGGAIKTCAVLIYNGVDQTTPIPTVTEEDGSGSPNDMTLTTANNNAVRIDAVGLQRDDAGDCTGSLDQGTLRANPQTPQNQFRERIFVYENTQATAGADTYQWTTSAFQRWYGAFEIKPAAGSNSAPTIAPNTADAHDFGTDTTPTLEFTGSDTDADNLTYEIQIDNNSDLSSPILSKASNADAGFANTVSGGDTDPFNAGEKISFTVQAGDALSPGTYYWRARVKDPSGSNTYSSYTTIRSFIINTAPTVAQNTADANDFGTDTTPTLEFTGTDVDSNPITYEIQIDNNSDCSSPILDKTSDVHSGFVNTVDGGDTDPFTSGQKVSYTVQGADALAPGTYYWRVKGKDPAGTNAYGSYSAIRSFLVKGLPTVTTQAASAVGETTATGNGNVTDTGNDTVTKRGFVYDTASHSAPGNVAPGSSGYAGDANDTGSFSTGAYTKGLTGLTASTLYYMRSYCQNAAGYDYGDEVSFTTSAPSNVFDTSASDQATGNPNTFANMLTVGNHVNRALVASISTEDSVGPNVPVISVKWGTLEFTKIRHDAISGSRFRRSELWILLNPPVGIGDLYIETNGSCWKAVVLTSLYNIKQEVPDVDHSNGATGTSTAPSVAITPTATESILIDALGSGAAPTALGASQVSLGTESAESFQNLSASRKEDVTAGATTMSGTLGSSAEWAISVTALEVEVATGTGEIRANNIPLIAGDTYLLRMWMRANREETINVKVQDSALANQAANENRLLPADTWTPFNFEFTAVATDVASVIRITLNMTSIQNFYIDRCILINLSKEKKQYRIMRIQGSLLPGSFVQNLTLREKTDAETA